MASQQTITSFFGSRKRRAVDLIGKDAKVFKSDPTLIKSKLNNDCFSLIKDNDATIAKSSIEEITCSTQSSSSQVTPRKNACDIRSYMTSQSPYRPECAKAVTPVKYLQIDSKAKNETTPKKVEFALPQIVERPHSSVKKSIRFEDEIASKKVNTQSASEKPTIPDIDDLIKAANDLVESSKAETRTLMKSASGSDCSKGPSRNELKKKLSKTAKLAALKSALLRLGQHDKEIISREKKKTTGSPTLTKFDTIEIEVTKSPHKGALASPVKSPVKPAHERFGHLIHKPQSISSALPLPFGFQRLLDLFVSTETICAMMTNRGELISFKKLKPAVQQLTRRDFTERHLAQIAAVYPEAYEFRQEKVRNFGSTSKADKYDLVIVPNIEAGNMHERTVLGEENLIRSIDRKRMVPAMLKKRKDIFYQALLSKTMDKHEEFLSSLEPPIKINRDQLTRWHPNFPLNMVPDIVPATLPESPYSEKTCSARDILDRAHNLLKSNDRVRNALGMASLISKETDSKPATVTTNILSTNNLDKEAKQKIDEKVAIHDPLKGISKSLLEKIRAKQAAKAAEAMKMTPGDEKEFHIISQLPEFARIVRTLYIDGQKGVFSWETVVDKIQFSSKRAINKGEVETILKRLISTLPEWLTVFSIKNVEYLKANRNLPFAPLMEKLEKLVADKRLP